MVFSQWFKHGLTAINWWWLWILTTRSLILIRRWHKLVSIQSNMPGPYIRFRPKSHIMTASRLPEQGLQPFWGTASCKWDNNKHPLIQLYHRHIELYNSQVVHRKQLLSLGYRLVGRQPNPIKLRGGAPSKVTLGHLPLGCHLIKGMLDLSFEAFFREIDAVKLNRTPPGTQTLGKHLKKI